MMYITLYYHDVAVVTFCKILLVSPVRLSWLHRSGGEPRPTSFGFGASCLPPPPAPLCSEALPVALQGRDRQKCDLRHAGRHARPRRVTPTADRPPGAYGEESGPVMGPCKRCSGQPTMVNDVQRAMGAQCCRWIHSTRLAITRVPKTIR